MFNSSGRLLGVTRTTTSGQSSPGMWSQQEILTAIKSSRWPSASITGVPRTDSYYSNVSLLLPGLGINNSNSFTDYSPTPKTITVYGDTKISTAQSKYYGSSIYFDGTGDFLGVTLPAFSTGDFTVETYIRLDSIASLKGIFDNRTFDQDTVGFILGVYLGKPAVYTSDNWRITSTTTLSINTWYHLALVRSSGIWKIYIDGIADANTYSSSVDLTRTVARCGMDWASLYGMQGYYNDYRVTNIARYTSNFTPPSSLLV